MAAKKRTKKRVDLPELPMRSQGNRADWSTVKKLVAWLNEHSDRDPEVAIDLALAAAHAITMMADGDPQDLDERYDEIRDLITVPATMQPLSPGGDA